MFSQRGRDHLLAFTKYTMPSFRINWHHRILCEYLERLRVGQITRLMVFMPPRSGKSELVSRRFPAYLFGRNPDEAIISTSYSDSLASMMNRDVQRIIDTEKYRQLFPEVTLNGDNVRSNVQGSWLRNNDIFEIVNRRGRYRSAGIGSGITGLGGSVLIIDDPIKNQKEADSTTFRDNLWEWYTSTFYTRLENREGMKGRILITLTRWHEDDLAGRLLDLAKADPKADQWTVLSFPAIKESDENPLDPRQMGEALWPDNQDLTDLSKIQASSMRIWNALYQQRPSPDSGNVVKREWWKFYTQIPDKFEKVGLSADLTFKDGEKNDFAVFQVWGRKGADKYLLDQVRRRMGFNEQLEVMKSLCQKWPNATSKWIEEAANGAALISTLRSSIPGIIAVRPQGSKLARAEAISPQVQAGNIYLPDPSIAPWINEYIEEWAMFPNGVHDDQVDTTTQAISKLTEGQTQDFQFVRLTQTSKFYGR